LLIWALIIADLVSGLLQTLEFSFYRVGLVLKGLIILGLFVLYLTRLSNKTFLSLYLVMLILSALWLIGFVISWINIPFFDAADSLVVLNRYLLFFILATAFVDWSASPTFQDETKSIFENFLALNNFFIFAGLIFGIHVFSTYDPFGDMQGFSRFGYKGLIFGQNAVAGIYTLGVAYLFRETFKYKRPKMVLLAITFIAAIVIGAKATWITAMLIAGYYLFKYRFKTFIAIVIPTVVILAYVGITYWPYIQQNYFAFLVEKYESLDFYTFWTSNRNRLLTDTMEHISDTWTFINYITGDASSYVEMDFFDLYFFFGVGAILYLYMYNKFFFLKDKSVDNKYFFFIWMSMAFVAGHLINSAIVPLFFLLYIFSASPGLESPYHKIAASSTAV